MEEITQLFETTEKESIKELLEKIIEKMEIQAAVKREKWGDKEKCPCGD